MEGFQKNASITRNYFFHRKTYTLWKFLYTNYGRISLQSFHNFYYFFPYLVHILWNFHLQVMDGFSKNPSITCIFFHKMHTFYGRAAILPVALKGKQIYASMYNAHCRTMGESLLYFIYMIHVIII